MTNCPYCGHKINTTKELPKMSKREFKVYNILLNGGREYTLHSTLMREVFGDKEGTHTSVRVCIHYLNNKLRKIGQVIVNHRGVGYRLEEA